VIEPGDGHNPVIEDVRIASGAIATFLTQHQVAGMVLPEGKTIKVGSSSDRLREQIDAATNAAALLEGIASAVRQLFGFHPLINPATQKFMGDDFGFSSEVHRMREVFQHIRTEQEVSWKDNNQLQHYFGQISQDLTLENSEVIKALLWYIVPFKTLFAQVLSAVDEELGAHYGKVWEASMSGLTPLADDYVLCEPPLLQQVLRNLLLNAKHVYPKGGQWRAMRAPSWCVAKDTVSDPEDATETLEYLVFTVSTPEAGQPLRRVPEGTTLEDHARSIAAYHGVLSVQQDPPHGMNTFELRLLSRNRTMAAWQKRLERRTGRG